jgi:hypothetical protein
VGTRVYLSLISLMTVIAGVVTLLAIFVTNPLKIGPLGVTFWFVALLIFMQGVFTFCLLGAKRRMFPTLGEHKIVTSSWRQGLLIGGWVVMLLALSSLRQLGWRDVVLLTGLLGLLEFYFRARV